MLFKSIQYFLKAEIIPQMYGMFLYSFNWPVTTSENLSFDKNKYDTILMQEVKTLFVSFVIFNP